MENGPLILALILIAAGILLVLAELFLPTGGILFALAIGALVVGVALPFLYGDSYTGLLLMVGVLILLPVLNVLMVYIWPHTVLARRLTTGGPEEDATLAAMPVYLELESLRGQFGRAVSALRPSGMVDFNGRRIDCLTEGMMVEPGDWVRCIEVKVGKVIVRPVDGPPDLTALENADFS